MKATIMGRFDPYKKWFAEKFDAKPEKVKFCHNDLNNLNIFIRPNQDHPEQK